MEKIKNYFLSYSPESQGIFWIVTSCFWFAVMATIIRHVSETMDPLQMVFIRNFFCMIIMLPWAFKNRKSIQKPKVIKLYFSRSFTAIFGMITFFYAISKVPLSHAISLTFTVPLITALLAVLFLKEKMPVSRWVAMFIGFSGVLFILKPGFVPIEPAALILLLTTILWSVSNILIKRLAETENHKTIVFIMMLIITPLSLPTALFVWEMPGIKEILWLFVLAWVTNQAQFGMVRAYSKADVGVLMPFDFSRLIFITILSYVFYNEIIDFWTLVGSLIILGSSVYIVRHTRKAKRKKLFVESEEV